MKTAKAWLAPALLLLATCGLFLLLSSFFESELVAAMSAASGAIIVSSFQVSAAKNKETEARLFPHKEGVYSELLSLLYELMAAARSSGNPMSQKQLVKRMTAVNQSLSLFGSTKTILAVEGLSAIEGVAEKDRSAVMIINFADLISSIRGDLGLSTSDHDSREIALNIIRLDERDEVRANVERYLRERGGGRLKSLRRIFGSRAD